MNLRRIVRCTEQESVWWVGFKISSEVTVSPYKWIVCTPRPFGYTVRDSHYMIANYLHVNWVPTLSTNIKRFLWPPSWSPYGNMSSIHQSDYVWNASHFIKALFYTYKIMIGLRESDKHSTVLQEGLCNSCYGITNCRLCHTNGVSIVLLEQSLSIKSTTKIKWSRFKNHLIPTYFGIIIYFCLIPQGHTKLMDGKNSLISLCFPC